VGSQKSNVDQWPEQERNAPPYETTIGFLIKEWSQNDFFVIAPHWFVVLVSGWMAGLLCLCRTGQFSIRNLLTATTFVAIILALDITLDK
jgi:hypothetical protein